MTYPIEDINSQLAIDGLNYVLSGPSGLGQDFAGFSTYSPGYLTSNFRVPYSVQSITKLAAGVNGASTITVVGGTNGILVGQTVTGPGIGTNATVTAVSDPVITLSVANTADIYDYYVIFTPPVLPRLYVAPISLSTSEWLDPYTWKFNFATPEPTPPFVVGNNITVNGVTPGDYDGGYSPIGVVECTTTYVIARTRTGYPDPGPGSGGTVDLYNTTIYPSEYPLSTDCNARVTVTGGTDRVFISAQLNNEITWQIDGVIVSDLIYTVSINRYRGEPNDNPVNPGYVFDFDKRVAEKTYIYSLTGPGPDTIDQETVFSTFVDADIPPGYYWYILDISFQSYISQVQVTQSKMGLRSITTQVVKQ